MSKLIALSTLTMAGLIAGACRAEDLLIENCVLSDASGTAPQAGIDFEPNLPGERIVNCALRNCTMRDNAGAGILIYLKSLQRQSLPVTLTVDGCHVSSGVEDLGLEVINGIPIDR